MLNIGHHGDLARQINKAVIVKSPALGSAHLTTPLFSPTNPSGYVDPALYKGHRYQHNRQSDSQLTGSWKTDSSTHQQHFVDPLSFSPFLASSRCCSFLLSYFAFVGKNRKQTNTQNFFVCQHKTLRISTKVFLIKHAQSTPRFLFQ